MRFFIYTKDMTVVSEKELHEGFVRFPEEIRWDYCNSTEEYICQGIQSKNLVEIKNYSPSEYGESIGVNIDDDISVADFDDIIDGSCYLVEECPCIEKGVIVKFADDTYCVVA